METLDDAPRWDQDLSSKWRQRAPKFPQQVPKVPEEKGQINSAREGKATRNPYFSVKRPKTIKKGQNYAYLDLL